MKKYAKIIFAVLFVAVVLVAAGVTGAVSEGNPFVGSFWSLVPPLVAIVLALITKEVYSSLLLGIAVGALLFANFSPVTAVDSLVQEGLIASVSG
ncbi:MAG: Na+/H+ antiporter NhaC family protein, partial [Clostridia bacterium]|nr:Na+/H+ antiporter NhaC family protein [Clostridia bacterium]